MGVVSMGGAAMMVFTMEDEKKQVDKKPRKKYSEHSDEELAYLFERDFGNLMENPYRKKKSET